MSLKCFWGMHNRLKPCGKCSTCGKIGAHDWSKDCETCANCGETRDDKHAWSNERWMKHVKGGMGRRVAALLLCLIFVSASATRIGAQSLSGDFRNTTMDIAKGTGGDVSLHVQTKQGKHVATAGITVKEGDKVQFDSIGWITSMTAGFWKGEDGETYIVDCCNKDRNDTSKLKLKLVFDT